MMMEIYIEPHERAEACQAYNDWLTPDEIKEIEAAPEGAIIKISRGVGTQGVLITIIEED